jgi:N-glycosylase/DNA lyase
MNIYESENKVLIENSENFDLSNIFDCGQCFRFNKTSKTAENHYEGVAFGKYLRAYQNKKENKIYFETNIDDFNNIWRDFFDIDRDYKTIFETLRKDEILRKASDFCPGIRILKQEPFECLISFIISANNNIPRIKKTIERLCENFGTAAGGIHDAPYYYTFPDAEKIASLTLDDLDVLHSGFRAKYILGAAKNIADGDINLESVYKMPLDEGSEYLQRIKGVGAKIAACVLLFAYNKLEAFPVDVWIKRVLEKYYPYDSSNLLNFSPQEYFGEYAGIAQEYLYYYERKNEKTQENKFSIRGIKI